MRPFALLALALFAGCATPHYTDQREDEQNLYVLQVRKQLKAGKISNKEAVVAQRNNRRTLGIADSYTEELDAYRLVLAGKMDRKELSADEAHYLEQQKVNEIIERLEAGIRTGAPAGAPFDTRAFEAARDRDAARQEARREMLRPGLEGARVTPGVTCRQSIMGSMVCQ